MNTYTHYNMNTMQQIIKAIDVLPEHYALRNESVRSIEMNDDDTLTVVNFAAMSMRRVVIPELKMTGWKVDGWDAIFIER
jgi:hypothetical protein